MKPPESLPTIPEGKYLLKPQLPNNPDGSNALEAMIVQLPPEHRATALESITGLIREQYQKCPRNPGAATKRASIIDRLRSQLALPLGTLILGSISLGLSGYKVKQEEPLVSPPAHVEKQKIEPTIESEPAILSAIETRDGKINPVDIRSLMATWPKGWDSEISAIIASKAEPPSLSHYGIHEGKASAEARGGEVAQTERSEKTSIAIFSTTDTAEKMWVIGHLFPHEAAHANDFRTKKGLTEAQRTSMRRWLEQRVIAPDRYQSDYVEKITTGNYDKAVEYWAEIVPAYLEEIPLPLADETFVKEQLKIQDPQFNRDEALKARDMITRHITMEPVLEEAKNLVDQVPFFSSPDMAVGEFQKNIILYPEQMIVEERKKLIDRLQPIIKSEMGKQAVRQLGHMYTRRTELIQVMSIKHPSIPMIRMHLKLLAQALDSYQQFIAREKPAIREKFTALSENIVPLLEKNIALSNQSGEQLLSPEEFFDIRERSGKLASPAGEYDDPRDWLFYSFGWGETDDPLDWKRYEEHMNDHVTDNNQRQKNEKRLAAYYNEE